MGNYGYSTIIVSHDDASLDKVVNVASALGESVAVVETEESFQALYNPDVRCVVLELHLPDSSCLGIIRALGHAEYRGSLVLTAAPQTTLNALNMARRLATGYGIVVLDTLVKPIDTELLLDTLIDATNPAVVKRMRAEILGPAAGRALSQGYGKEGCNGSC